MAATGENRRPLQVAESKGKPDTRSPDMLDGLGLMLSVLSVNMVLHMGQPPWLQVAAVFRFQWQLGPASKLLQQLVLVLALNRPLQAEVLVDGEEVIEIEAVVAVMQEKVLVEAGARQTLRPLICFG